MNIGKILGDAVGGTASKLIDSVGNIADKFITTKEEKEQFKQQYESIVNSHMQEMENLLIKREENLLKDNENARNREVEIATSEKAPLLSKIITPVMALVCVLLTFGMFYMLLFKDMGAEKDIVIYVLGALTAMTGQVTSYYFGSSSSSTKKQEMIGKMIK